jgi:hypothetical protein
MMVYLRKSNKPDKKFKVIVELRSGVAKTIHFGAKGMSDYTKHKNKARKQLYLSRHRKNENWTRSGIKTAGFWSRWLLWNKPSLLSSKRDIEKRFKINFF